MSREKKGETRKIQLTGGSTYTVSLPKKWVEELELDAGDEMLVEEQSSSLLLSPKGMEKEMESEVTVEITQEESIDTVKRKILSLYLVGYNVIKIRSSEGRFKSERRNAVKELVRSKLVGTEIISESIEEITLQTLLTYTQLSAKGAMKRMFRVTASMQENAMTALEENDMELAREVTELDDEVDRFQMYLIREIKAAMQDPSMVEDIGLSTLRECLAYRLVSKHVERVGDHAAKIAHNALEMEKPVEKKTLEMLEGMNTLAQEVLEQAVESLFENDYEAAEDVIQKMDDLHRKEEEFNEYLSEEKPPEAIKIRLIVESIRRTAEYGMNIAEVVLNLTVRNIL